MVKEYRVENLSCAHCSAQIEENLAAVEGVESVNLDFVSKKLVIQFAVGFPEALKRLNLVAKAIEPDVNIKESSEEESTKSRKLYWTIALSGLLLFGVSQILDIGFTEYLVYPAWLMVSYRVLFSAVRKLMKARIFDEHFLMGIAGLGALYLGETIEAMAVIILYEIGQSFEASAVNKSRALIRKILSVKPDKAHLIDTTGLRDVKLNQVTPGQLVAVYPGERIPLDGVIRKGNSSVDTSSLTGESEPVSIEPGGPVMGGFINLSSYIEIEVGATEAESTVSRIMKLIESASMRKSPTEKFITRFAKWYTPIVVGAAALLVLIPLALGAELAVWLPRALIFLIVSCPCALVISVPLSYYVAIGIAAKQGIIFKGSAYMDMLRRIKNFVFDKTGTLTTGKLRPVTEFVAEGSTKGELWEAISLCEHGSSHPLAMAVKKSYPIEFDTQKLQEYTEFPGKGIQMIYQGDEYVVGSLVLLQDLAYMTDAIQGDFTSIHAIKNHVYLGYIGFADELKPGMKEALSELRAMGASTMHMLSGDRGPKAQQVALELGLDQYHAELTPQDKLHKLEEIMQDRATAYVGDGLNDAPVLARADLGIAMGELGNPSSIEAADIVLLNDKPEQLSKAMRLSHYTYRIVVQNISLALGIKLVVMILGALGMGHLWQAVIADVGVTLLAILNAMRITKTHSE